ncbi:MAG: V-type ATP synthase subunit F [Brevinematia bacterium]
MKIVGIFDKYTAEVFKFLGIETYVLSPDDQNIGIKVSEKLSELKGNKKVFSILISKNISSKTRKEIEDFIMNNSRPSIVEVDPMYNIDIYEDYETIIKRTIKEILGIKL